MRSRTVILVLVLALTVPTLAVALTVPPPPSPVAARAPDVRIDRDAYGVPHVYANTTYGLFWGNGYAQAQDRLFQMDVLRHVARGRGAEVLGPSLLALDVATRRDLYTETQRTQAWQGLPADQKLLFQSFADGVNAWVLETRKDPTKLSAEFDAIAHPPEDWIPEDTIAIAQFLLAIFGAGNGGGELENAQILARMLLDGNMTRAEAEKAFDDLFWIHDAASYSTIPPSAGSWAGAQDAPLALTQIPSLQWQAIWAAANATPAGDVRCFVGPGLDAARCSGFGALDLRVASQVSGLPLKWGSNALVVDGAHSASGRPLLLGGPQMSYYNPMIPYEVALHGAGYEALGMGVGGAPGVIIGRTANYSWTVTSGEADQVDAVAEKLVPGTTNHYFQNGVDKAMECRTEVHFGPPTAIDANPPVLATQEVCRTDNGPVFAINKAAGIAFVHQSTHRGDELRSGILWLTLARSPDLASFRAHMGSFCFTFNFLQADRDHIAYNHWGCNPVHETTTPYDVRLPRPSDAAFAWAGVRSGSALPHIEDPTQGYLVNWNNLPQQGFSAGAAREQWGTSHRVQLFDATVQKFLAGGHKLTDADLEAINLEISTRDPFASWFIPSILSATAASTDPQVQDARAALAAWQACGACFDDSHGGQDVSPGGSTGATYVHPGLAVYEAWRTRFQGNMKDEIGSFSRPINFDPPTDDDPHAADHGRTDNKDQPLLNAVLGRSAHAWCDTVQTPAVESCDDAIRASLAGALTDLTAEFGSPDVATWHRPIHMIEFSALSGGPAWRIPMVNRPSFNHYYDWGTGVARSVLPPGTDQYWFPQDFLVFRLDGSLPAHKDDQLTLYREFQFKPADLVPVVGSSASFLSGPPPVTAGCASGTGCAVSAPITG